MISWAEHVRLVSAGEVGFPVVEVIWWDAIAFGTAGWSDNAETSLCRTTTVGYFVGETEDAISVASIINVNHVGHGMVIPKRDIISWRDLT